MPKGEYLTTKEVADMLNVTKRTVLDLYDKKLIKSRHKSTPGGYVRLAKQEDVEAYMESKNITAVQEDHARASSDIPDIVCLSFFSGAMGLDIGLSNVGIHPLLLCENDKTCRMTISENAPDAALIGDIFQYSTSRILEMANITKDRKVDVIVGGPPCQAFSTAGARRGLDDERGNALLRYVQVINEIRPRYFVIENVRGLLSAAYTCVKGLDALIKGGALFHVLQLLRGAGYAVSFNLYNSANYGAPQIRERVVLIGYLGGEKVPYLRPTHSENGDYGLPKWRTLREAIGGLDPKGHNYVDFPQDRLYYLRMLKEGQNWKDLPEKHQKKAMGNSYNLGGGKTGFYRRLAFDKPSPTLVTHPAMPATDLAHPVEDRPLSVEEYRRIQEFPGGWKICGSIQEQYRQIGNAVPIKLGEAIGRTILAHMRREKQDSEEFKDFPYSRYRNTDDRSWELQVLSDIIERQEEAQQTLLPLSGQ